MSNRPLRVIVTSIVSPIKLTTLMLSAAFAVDVNVNPQFGRQPGDASHEPASSGGMTSEGPEPSLHAAIATTRIEPAKKCRIRETPRQYGWATISTPRLPKVKQYESDPWIAA
jgi:hypothetical protein